MSVLTLSIFSWSSITHDLFPYIGFYCCSWNKIWTCLTKVLSWQYLCWIKNKYIQKVSPTRDIVPSWEVKHHVQDIDFLKKKKKMKKHLHSQGQHAKWYYFIKIGWFLQHSELIYWLSTGKSYLSVPVGSSVNTVRNNYIEQGLMAQTWNLSALEAEARESGVPNPDWAAIVSLSMLRLCLWKYYYCYLNFIIHLLLLLLSTSALTA